MANPRALQRLRAVLPARAWGTLAYATDMAQREQRRMELISHPEILGAVFSLLLPAEQCVTVSRLSRGWRAWAAGRRSQPQRGEEERRQAERRELDTEWLRLWAWRQHELAGWQLPAWCVREAWPHLTPARRAAAACRAARRGDAAMLQWMHATGAESPAASAAAPAPSKVDWSGDISEAAALGGQLAVLQWLKAVAPLSPRGRFECRQLAKGRAKSPGAPPALRAACEAVVEYVTWQYSTTETPRLAAAAAAGARREPAAPERRAAAWVPGFGVWSALAFVGWGASHQWVY